MVCQHIPAEIRLAIQAIVPLVLPPPVLRSSQGYQKHDAFALSVGREKLGNVVIEEGQAASPKPLGVSRQVQPAAPDAGLHLGQAIAPVAVPLQNRV